MQGYKSGRPRSNEARRRELRESNIADQLESFNGLFEASIANGLDRKSVALSKAQRVYYGVDR